MNDYIRREDVIEALYRSCDSICPYSLSERKMVCGSCTRGKVSDVIKNEIPAADVRENVRGEWVYSRVAFHCVCSNCDCAVRLNKDYIFQGYGALNFCPNCGADMRKTDSPDLSTTKVERNAYAALLKMSLQTESSDEFTKT